MIRVRALSIAALAASALAGGCSVAARPAAESGDVLLWRSVGTWSGRTSMQTESFLNESGLLLIQWETRNEAAGQDGSFRATFHSAVSGRPLASFVGGRGTAHGSTLVAEDPRPTYVVVESKDVKWNFTLQEGFAARPGEAGAR